MRRFWLPSGQTYDVDDDGFLADPERAWGGVRWSNADASIDDDLRHYRVLVLLGEPGMGKSTFLKETRPLLPKDCDAKEVSFDLAEFGSEDRFVRSIEESVREDDWLTGAGELCLTLDGFDDAQTRIPRLGVLFAGMLKRWPLDRLWLRIACRTSDWPPSLAAELLRPELGAKVVELLPLRRADVSEVASAAEIDPRLFLSEVEARNVGVLAARPLTLNFLLRSFTQAGHRLPDRAADLYRHNLLAMCDEQNPARWTASAEGASSGDLYAVARRVAAASAFGGFTAVWTGPLPVPPQEDVVALGVLAGGNEPTGAERVSITPSLVREVTRTPLFSGHGQSRMSWAHTTFQDFLAAEWMLANKLSDIQVRSLLLADDGGVRPQVRRVAAWTLVLAPERFRSLTERDPESFIGVVDIPDHDVRRILVDLLLKAAEADHILEGFSSRYDGLSHPDLGDQLAPVLAEPGAARWLAIRMTYDCDVAELDHALASIALDPAAALSERLEAGSALAWRKRAGNTLLPLVINKDLHGAEYIPALLGVGLRASWPHEVSTAQALDAITEVSAHNPDVNFGGFVHEFSQELTPADLDAAASWLVDHTDTDGGSILDIVRNACLKLCAKHLDNAGAAAAAAAAAKAQLLRHDRVWADDESFPTDTRRRLALLITDAAASDVDAEILSSVICDCTLLSADDFLWLLDLAREPNAHEAALRLLPRLVDPTRIEHANAVLEIDAASPLRPALRYWLDTCDLADPAIAEVRANWQRIRERQASRENPHDDVEHRIIDHLNEVDSGDNAGYWQAARLVCVRPGTEHYWDEHQPDLTVHPRWERLLDTTKDRLVSLAPRYLADGQCSPEKWLAQGLKFYPAEAGYRAMLLLLRLDPVSLDNLSSTAWQEWAPIIVAWPVTANGARPEDKKILLRRALPYACSELRTTLLALVDDSIRTGQLAWLHIEFDALWDDQLQDELLRRLQESLPNDVRAALADAFMRNAPEAAQELLIPWLDQDSERSNLAVALLVSQRLGQAWTAIRPWFDAHQQAAKDMFLDQAYGLNPPRDLPVDALTDLCLWLWEQFPPDEDPDPDDRSWISSRTPAGDLRDRILQDLLEMGTDESLAAIQRIVTAHADVQWLNRTYAAAQEVHRRVNWQATSPAQLRLIAEDASRRLVNSEAELLDSVTDALARIQRRLIGETPESHLLWNTAPLRRLKSEDEISDYLRNRITDELTSYRVVVNREVQVRRNTTSGIGERVDLRVDAINPHRDDVLTVIIEAKIASNSEVRTALQTQLVDRYMHDIGTTAGIFLVIWPDNEAATTPAGNTSTIARASLTAQLDQQVRAQADHGRDIRVVHLDVPYLRPNNQDS